VVIRGDRPPAQPLPGFRGDDYRMFAPGVSDLCSMAILRLGHFGGLKMHHRLLALAVGGIVLTASLLVGVGAWQTASFGRQAAGSVDSLVDEQREQVSTDVTRLTTAVGDGVQAVVNRAQTVAVDEMTQRGGLHFGTAPVVWEATNQFTQQKTKVTLPQAMVGGRWLGQNRDLNVPTAVVDDVRHKTGGTVTIFQRMNAAGDMIRVATNVPNKAGNRAIGTYIPVIQPDHTNNPVLAAVLAGKPYRGVAQVVDTWYVTGYDPLKDSAGNVVGVIYFGMPQAEAIDSLTRAIAKTRLGKHGSVLTLVCELVVACRW
jgi:hypothetical protein